MKFVLDCWTDFASFLRKPEHTVSSGLRTPGSLRLLGALWALESLGLVVMVTMVFFWLKLTGLPGPNAFDMLPKKWLLPLTVFAAPLLEEPLFRGWLSGRPRALWLLVCGVGLTFVTMLQSLEPITTAVGLIALLLAMPCGWFLLRKHQVPSWFVKSFPAIFWMGTAIFSLVHLLNYPHPGPLALPVILPQIWSGLVFSYVRVRIGLAAAMLIHAGSNAMMVMSLWL